MHKKSDLVSLLAEKTSLTKAEVTSVLDAYSDIAIQSSKDSGECILPGLGKFKLTHRAERSGRNPQTGQPVTIPAQNSVKFVAGKVFKDAVK